MSHAKPTCGAKTRSGEACRNAPMGNGRCRMHGGKSKGAPPGNANAAGHGAPAGNQNARSHGVWSKFLTLDDLQFLEAPATERLAMLQGVAELRAFRAHQAGLGDEKNTSLDEAFNRCARTAANLARTRLALAEAAADGVTPDGGAGEDDAEQGTMTDHERVQKLARILDGGAASGAGGAAGPSLVAALQPGPDRGPPKPG